MTLSLQSPSFDLFWDSRQGAFRLQSPGRMLHGVAGVEIVAQRRRAQSLTTDTLAPGRVVQGTLTDAHGEAHEMHVEHQACRGLALSLRIRLYPSRPFVLFRVSVTNVGTEPIRVRRFFLRTLPDGLRSVEPPHGFYVNGWQSWSPMGFVPAQGRGFTPRGPVRWLQGPMIQNAHTPWNHRVGRFWSETVGALVTPREALVAGATSLADQFAQVWADLRPGHQALMMQSQADDVPLTVGEALSSEWFYAEWVPLSSVDPLAQYAYAVIRQMGLSTPRTPPTGWCSWYTYWDEVAEPDVMKNLASAALLADEIPLEVLQLDDGYQAAWGDWTQRNARFPHDLSWLAERIHGSDFTPGLWLAPLVLHTSSQLAQRHPEWLLRNRRGRPVSAGLVSGAIGRALDPTHPGVQTYLRELAQTAVQEWGYEYLKLDFMYAGALAGRRHNPRLTRAQAMRLAFQIIRETVGEATYLLGCGAPLASAIGLVDAMRIAPDTAPDWSPRWPLRDNPSMPSLRNSLHGVASRAWMHNRWWTNDPDPLLMRDTQTQLTDDEVRAQVTLLGLSGGTFMLSDPLDALPPERREMAATLLPPLLEGMDVLDLFDDARPGVVLVPVARAWGRWRLIGLFNWQDEPVERSLPADLALDERRAYHIVDFWARRYVRFAVGDLAPVFHLPPHGAVLLGLRSIRPNPHLVTSTFHISQGGEVTDWSLEGEELSLSLDVGRRARGELWFALPARPSPVHLDGAPVSQDNVRAISRGIWAVRCYVDHAATLHLRWEAP